MSKLASVCHSNLIYVVEKNNTAAPSCLLVRLSQADRTVCKKTTLFCTVVEYTEIGNRIWRLLRKATSKEM
jgi:hypothetical protein